MTTDLVPAETITAELVPDYSGADYAVSDATLDRMKRVHAVNTRTAYGRQWAAFEAWCVSQGRVSLPATPHTIVEYANHLADLNRAPSTMEQAWAAIVHHHKATGNGDFPSEVRERYADLVTVHRRDRAERGEVKRQSAPVTVNVVAAMVATLDTSTLAGLRDRVAVVLGYSGTLRRAELAALDIRDLSFGEEGLTITVRTSKTDRESKGQQVRVPYGSRAATCPVRTTQAWLAALAERGMTSGRLLRRIRRGDVLTADGVSGAAINDLVKRLAARIDAPGAERMTAHGLRAGAPTDMSNAGKPMARIAEQGRWSKDSTTVLGYCRTADAWRDHPLIGIGL